MAEVTELKTPPPQVLTETQQAVLILQKIKGWGRQQASVFVAELDPHEVHAIVMCGVRPEVAHVRQRLLNEISDRVVARRKLPVASGQLPEQTS